jgi:hypothetical protein
MYDEKWFGTTEDEIKAYLALCIIMTVVNKPTTKLKWSKRSIVQTLYLVKQCIRFILISRFLLCTDCTSADANNKLGKVRSVIPFLNGQLTTRYVPQEAVAIDESLMKFRGRLS